jgi:hypothetical protein
MKDYHGKEKGLLLLIDIIIKNVLRKCLNENTKGRYIRNYFGYCNPNVIYRFGGGMLFLLYVF